MQDQQVQIIYEAVVRGQEKVVELARANEQLKAQTEAQAKTVKRLTEEHNKNESSMLKARHAIQAFRREMFAFGFVAASMAGALAFLAKGSDNLASALSTLGKETAQASKPLGDLIAKYIRFYGGKGFTSPDLSIGSQNKLSSMFADIEALRGNSASALREKLRADEIKMADEVGDKWESTFKRVFDTRKKLLIEQEEREKRVEILSAQAATAKAQGNDYTSLLKSQEAERLKIFRNSSDERQKLIEKEVLARQEAEREMFRLEKLGLERHRQILEGFNRDVIAAMRGGTSDAIFGALEGQGVDAKNIIKSISSDINRATADALSKALFTSLAGGGGEGGFMDLFKNNLMGKDGTASEVKRSNDKLEINNRNNTDMIGILKRIAECTCAAVSQSSTIGRSMTATVTPPGSSTLSKIGAVAGLVGSFGALGGLGGSSGPILTIPGEVPRGHSGGFVGSFASGGEVPIMAQPGEFVVRRAIAQDNKDVLQDINTGSKKVKGTTNVFLIKANDAQSFADMLSSPSARAMIEMSLIRSIMTNGQVRQTIKNFT